MQKTFPAWSLASLQPHQRVVFLAHIDFHIPTALVALGSKYEVVLVKWDELDEYHEGVRGADTSRVRKVFSADVIMCHPIFAPKARTALRFLCGIDLDAMDAAAVGQVVVMDNRVRDAACQTQLWTY